MLTSEQTWFLIIHGMLTSNFDGWIYGMVTSYHVRYVAKWFADILLKIWYVDIQCMMLFSHLIIFGILINRMLTSEYSWYVDHSWYVDK